MKFLITTCLIFCCYSICFSQHSYFYSDSSNNRPHIIAANGIKKDSIYSFTLKNGKVVDSFNNGSETFNEHGYKIEQRTLISPRNGVFVIDSFFYNDKQWRIRYTMTTSGGQRVGEITYTLNEAGKETSSYNVFKSRDSLDISRSESVYNVQGRLTEIYTYFGRATTPYIRRFYYGAEGRIVKETAIGNDGKTRDARSVVYEKNRATWYNLRTGKPDKGPVFFYNDAGQCIKITNLYGGLESRFIYNSDGTLYEWSSYRNGKKEKMDRHYYYK
jgi:hypothetical protein